MMNQMDIVKIVNDETISDEKLSAYAVAYDLRLSLYTLARKISDEDKGRIAYLGYYCWLKSENHYSLSHYFDAIMDYLNDGNGEIKDLEKLDKWGLLNLLESRAV